MFSFLHVLKFVGLIVKLCCYLAVWPEVPLYEDTFFLIHEYAVVVVIGHFAQGQCLGWDGQQATFHGWYLQPNKPGSHSRSRKTIMCPHLCLYRGEFICMYSSLPQHLQVCVYVRYTWHRAVRHRWQRVGRSRPGSPRDWCCPGPLSHLEGWSSPSKQGVQQGVTQVYWLSESQACCRQVLTYFNHMRN